MMWYERRTGDEYSEKFYRCDVCGFMCRIGQVPEGGPYEPPVTITGRSFIAYGCMAIQLSGTTVALGDGSSAPIQAPAQIDIDLSKGNQLIFTVDGSFGTAADADGLTASIVAVTAGAQNSISDLTAPDMSLVGVFLTDDAASGTAPATLDFTLEATRNYTSLSPSIAQVFYIGEGEYASSDVVYYRKVTVPATATRLFVGCHTTAGWASNKGTIRGVAHVSNSYSQVDEFQSGGSYGGVYLNDMAASQGCPACGSPAWRAGGKAGDLKRGY
jgi:hypothetical protein